MSTYIYTIEFVHEKWWLCQRGYYARDSVLDGQEFRQLNKPYESKEAAIASNPDAKVLENSEQPQVYIPKEPPEWFDPADAGEVWSEDDY